MAAEEVTTASPATPSTIRQLIRFVLDSLAILLLTRLAIPQAREQLLAGLPDVPCPERQRHVAVLHSRQERVDAPIQGADVLHVAVAKLADALDHRFGGGSGDGLLGCGVDVHDEQAVGL